MVSDSDSLNNKKLKFNKPIIGTIKKPISNKELLKRLLILSDELSAVDQDNPQLDTFKKIQKDLVNKKLLLHSHLGIQAYVCCCISDILRITAPNAPFTTEELTQIFMAIFRQFRELNDKESQYYYQRCYLLKRLAEVRSIILITELPNAEELMILIFEIFYDIAKLGLPANLEPLISDILSEVISESNKIPNAILKLILDRFTSDLSGTPLGNSSNISNCGLLLSIQICEANLERMSRLAAQLFSEQIYENSSTISLSKQDIKILSRAEKSKYDNAILALGKVHNMIIQIWKCIPELLSSVMGLLDDEFNADEEYLRKLATETIGKILGSVDISLGVVTTKVNFFVSHKNTWSNFLKKTTDICPAVRQKWVELLPGMVKVQNFKTYEICLSVRKCLHKCLLDTDEKVRLSACKAIADIPFDLLINKVCHEDIVSTLFHLTREKNIDIRKSAIRLLGHMYDLYMLRIIEDKSIDFGHLEEIEIEKLEDSIKNIPNQILTLVYINDKSINADVDFCVFEHFVPIFESNTSVRVERILRFYSGLDKKAKRTFFAIQKRQQQVSNVLETFLETTSKLKVDQNNVEEKENTALQGENIKATNKLTYDSLLLRLDKIINWLSATIPDGFNSYACLERFSKLKNARLQFLIRTCISSESEYNTVRNSLQEILKRLNDSNTISTVEDNNIISTMDMVATFKLLLFRGSNLAYNRSNIDEFIQYSKKSEHEWAQIANELLENISISVPNVLKWHFEDLTSAIINNNKDMVQYQSLKTVYHFIQRYTELYPDDINFSESLKRIAIGNSPVEAKYAIKILGLSNRKEIYYSAIVNNIYPLDLNGQKFSTHLSALAEIILLDPALLEDKINDITTILIKEVLLQNRSMDKGLVDETTQWLDDDILHIDYKKHLTLYEKTIAMRFLVNKIRSIVSKDSSNNEEKKERISKQSVPILKLLVSFIGNGGELLNEESQTWPTPELYKLKLRLLAGSFILKLCKIPEFNELIYPSVIQRLTLLLTDLNYNVRYCFLSKLEKNLVNDNISERFLPTIFFCALETDKELKLNASIWISSYHRRQVAKNSIKVEKSLVRIIHILAHHEHFENLLEEGGDSNLLEAFVYILKFIIFFISIVSTSDNISMLYYFASRVKQYKDATSELSDYEYEVATNKALNIYRVAELAQFIIKEYTDLKNWPIQTWPGKLKLPHDIFVPMANATEVQNVITKVFLPELVQADLRKVIRKYFTKTQNKIIDEIQHSTQSKKNRSSTKSRRVKKRRTEFPADHAPPRKSSRPIKEVNYTEELLSDEENNLSDEYDVYV